MTTPSPTPPPASVPKRLTRTREDRWLGGVCGGIGRYAGLDANLVRLLAVVAFLVSCGTAVLAYLVAWVVIPPE